MPNKNLPGFTTHGGKVSARTASPSELLTDDDLAEQAGRYFLAVPECLAWWTGGVYSGHSLKRKRNGWLLVVKMSLRRQPVVSFTEASTVAEAVRQFAIGIAHDLVDWYPDDYT